MRAFVITVAATAALLVSPGCHTPGAASAPRAPATAPSDSASAHASAAAPRERKAAQTEPGQSGAERPTGFEDTVWGATREQLAAVYPGFPQVSAYIYGLEATVELLLDDGRLHRIRAEFAQHFPGMERCGVELERLRAELGKELGRSQIDNLSAEWRTESSEISLACNLDDDEGVFATLSLVYQPYP